MAEQLPSVGDKDGDGFAVEEKMGISTYMTTHDERSGFSAVLKARYSDFVVHEVNRNGTVACLTNLSIQATASLEKIGEDDDDGDDDDDGCKNDKKDESTNNSKDDSKNDTDMAQQTQQQEQQQQSSNSEGDDADTTARSKKRKLDEDDESTKPQTEAASADSAVSQSPLITDEQVQWRQAESALQKLVGKEPATSAIALLQHWQQQEQHQQEQHQQDSNCGSSGVTFAHDNANDDKSDDPLVEQVHRQFYTFPATTSNSDKESRRALHHAIRAHLGSCALADTHNGQVRIWHKRFAKHMPNYGQFDRTSNNGGRNSNTNRKKAKKAWPMDRPDYLQFVMYKENMDTSYACKEIVGRLVRNGAQCHSSRNMAATGRGRGRGRGRGQIQGQSAGIGYAGMKDKRGVTSQFCTLYRQEPQTVLATGINKLGGGNAGGGGNTTSGGVNVLRVGNFEYVPNELQLGMLSGNRFHVVLRNVNVLSSTTNSSADDGGNAKDEDDNRIAQTKTCLEAAAKALDKHGFINYFGMQRFGKYHDTHKVGLCVLKGDYAGAVEIILKPKPDKMPRFANARLEWSRRFDKLNANMSNNNVDNDQKDARKRAERDCARRVLKDLGRFMNCEVAILNSLVRHPCDYRRAFGCIPRNMRMMFLHAVQSLFWNRVASDRIDTLGRNVVVGDLVLVEDRSKAEGGSGTSGLEGKAVKVVDAGDLDSNMYGINDVVLPVVGTKMQYPENDSGALFDSLLAEFGITKDHFRNAEDREMNFKGDYRKLVCKPTDVAFDILEYTDPLQPLLRTDLMKVDGVELDLCHSDAERDGRNKEILLGMVISFTLPPSAYATIALRELMKRPTCSEYQSQLKLKGVSEGDRRCKEG